MYIFVILFANLLNNTFDDCSTYDYPPLNLFLMFYYDYMH
jgi:hypothetical protein